MYKKIDDYGFIGDMHSVALVSGDGSIDYCCMPRIDSPTVFAALLDDEKGGQFKIAPTGSYSSQQSYLKDINILRCEFTTKQGVAELRDFMPVYYETELYGKNGSAIYRWLKVTQGSVTFKVIFSPRPGYAAKIPKLILRDKEVRVVGKDDIFKLVFNRDNVTIKEVSQATLVMEFSLQAGEEMWFVLRYGRKASNNIDPQAYEITKKFWLDWFSSCHVGFNYGEYEPLLKRSILAIKLLSYQPTGAIAAAATTSLPESIGGERNWDYRYSWLRDASLTMKAIFSMGHVSETDAFIRWLHSVYHKYSGRDLQIMYSIEGEARLKERMLKHLKGYKESRPVRVGNEAYKQKQHDIYGEVMDTALRLSDYAGRIDEELWPFLREICNEAIKHWQEPDYSIWEIRSGPYHFVHSKVMCWVALDRGITIAKRYGFDAELAMWQQEVQRIKKDILKKGYDTQLKSFVQYYGSKNLDSSLLLLPLVGFLPIEDERIQGTIEACMKNLTRGDFLLRYTGYDGLTGTEGAFLLCNFWLIECLILSNRLAEAESLLKKTIKTANHLGLFSEEYDVENKQMLGNFPQAFTHIGFINAVNTLLLYRKVQADRRVKHSLKKRIGKLLPFKLVLNKTDREVSETSENISQHLKRSLTNMRGKFFDVAEGNVNYQALRKSADYQDYLARVQELVAFNPFILKDDDEKIAFWINIYNVLIIHGVIELDIQRSVKEVLNFFGRIQYKIGDFYFTPDDIEHGILRGNVPHPFYGRRQFSKSDKRIKLIVKKPDPHIHSALVCASSSCPPIDFYDSARIRQQLHLATRSFINRDGVILNKDENVLYFSQIFKWYRADFGNNEQRVVDFILPYVRKDAAKYIKQNRKNLKIKYLNYDWNLNRSLKELGG